MSYRTLDQADLSAQRVLMRAGFDVPLDDGVVADTARIEAVLPTMKYILDAGASLVLMAHQGRPKGERVPEMSQKPLVPVLEKLLGRSVQFADSCTGPDTQAAAEALQSGEVLLLENLRYDEREKKNDPAFAQELASLADVYVNDAFTNCHRDHASMTGVPKILPAYMGLQLQAEVEHLGKALEDPARPLVLIVSGAKMETKIPVIQKFLAHGDEILLGGCIANTFLAAQKMDVGASRYEEEEIPTAQDILKKSESTDYANVHVPLDAITATELSADAATQDASVQDIHGAMSIFDIGPITADQYAEVIANAGTIIWNGPLGVCEYEQFSKGTHQIADAVLAATQKGATSIIGGGDTLDFHDRYNLRLDVYSFVSTGGGAMLEFIAGSKLPAIEMLKS